MPATAPVTVVFFAVLREQAGRARVEVEAAGMTPRELYARLAAEQNLSLPLDKIRFALGGEYVPGDAPLAPGDELLLIPPVAGG